LAAAALLVIAALVRAWFAGPGVSVGLWGVELCENGCHGVRWDDVPGAQGDLYLAGYAAVAAALLGAGLAVSSLFGARTARAARIVLTIALVGMAYFILRGIALGGLHDVGVSWALVAGPIAAVALRQLIVVDR
jgi:hypothetical protein